MYRIQDNAITLAQDHIEKVSARVFGFGNFLTSLWGKTHYRAA